MILNKSAVERGLAHASLYKTECVNLKEERGGGGKQYFAATPHTQMTRVSGNTGVGVWEWGRRGVAGSCG